MPTRSRFDVAIIGAGIIGSATAAALAARGRSVAVIDTAATPVGASQRSYAWLNTASSRDPEYHRLREVGLRFHLLEHARWGAGSPYSFVGSVAWADAAGIDQLDADAGEGAIGERHRALSGAGHAVRLADRAEAARFEPALSEAALGRAPFLIAEDEGWVDLPRLVASRVQRLQSHGGVLVLTAAPARLTEAPDRVGVVVDGESIDADQVLVAAGAQTPALLADVGLMLPERSSTGTLIVATDGGAGLSRLVRAPGVSVRPHGEATLVIHASAVDEAAGPWDALDRTGGVTLSSAVVGAALAEAESVLRTRRPLRPIELRQGARPVPSDGLPVLGRVRGFENLAVAFTHSGATLGLAVGELLARELSGEHERIPLLDPYRADRLLQPVPAA